MVPIPRDAIEISLCSVCGQRVLGNAGLCAHHAAVSTDSWAVGNRILCDFFHRGIAPPRLPAADRIVLGLPETLAVGDVMTRSVLRVRAATSIRDAARLMYERKLGALPVVEGERLIGLLTETDVLRAFQELLGPTTAPAVTP